MPRPPSTPCFDMTVMSSGPVAPAGGAATKVLPRRVGPQASDVGWAETAGNASTPIEETRRTARRDARGTTTASVRRLMVANLRHPEFNPT